MSYERDEHRYRLPSLIEVCQSTLRRWRDCTFFIFGLRLTQDSRVVDLDSMTGVPYRLAAPILATCDPVQLARIEAANAEYVAHTDHLWKVHYDKRFSSKGTSQVSEEEGSTVSDASLSWRERYDAAEEAYHDKLNRSKAKLKRMYQADSNGKLSGFFYTG